MPVNLKDLVILNKNSADYHRIINGISKYDTVNLLQKANMTKERSIVKVKQLQQNITTYKIGEEIITFSNIEVEKHKFQQYKNATPIYHADSANIEVSNMVPFGKRRFK